MGSLYVQFVNKLPFLAAKAVSLLEMDFYPDYPLSPFMTKDCWTYGLASTQKHIIHHKLTIYHRLVIIYNTCLIEISPTP